MIIHLFPYSFFINSYVRFLEENYDISQHRVVVYRKGNYARDELQSDLLIRYVGKKDIFILRKLLRSADRVVIHALGVEIEMLMLLYADKSICRKTVWVIWGSDLYCKRDVLPGLMSRYIEHMREVVIGRFPYIASLVRGDYDLAKKWYRTDAEMIRVNYCSYGRERLDELITQPKPKADSTVNVIIGNSGTRSNCHLELIDKLRKWIDKDIRFYIPLSYGDPGYIEEIKAKYTEVFGQKAVIMDKLMPLNDYQRLLSSIDIGIFNNDRQQALGNILTLLYMGKKIYMRENTSMWDEFVNIQGFNVLGCDRISEDSFPDGLSDEGIIEQNRRLAEKMLYDIEEHKKGWDKVFMIS